MPPKKPPKNLFKPVKGLTMKQAAFVRAYIVCGNAKEAAMEAGVAEKNAASVGCQWLDEVRFPRVNAEINRLKQQLEMRSLKKADDVLLYIQTAMWIHPTDYFLPGGADGGWLIDPAKLDTLPPEVKRLIEEIRIVKREVETDEGKKVTTMASVKLVSKAKAMELAAKHQLDQKVSVSTVSVPWDEIASPRVSPAQDVEDRLREERALLESSREVVVPLKSLPPPGTNGKGPSTNGNGTH